MPNNALQLTAYSLRSLRRSGFRQQLKASVSRH